MLNNPFIQAMMMAKAKQDPLLNILLNLANDLKAYEEVERVTQAFKFLRIVAEFEISVCDENLTKILTEQYKVTPESAPAFIAASRNYGKPVETLRAAIEAAAPADLPEREKIVETLVKVFMTDEQYKTYQDEQNPLGSILGELLSKMTDGQPDADPSNPFGLPDDYRTGG